MKSLAIQPFQGIELREETGDTNKECLVQVAELMKNLEGEVIDLSLVQENDISVADVPDFGSRIMLFDIQEIPEDEKPLIGAVKPTKVYVSVDTNGNIHSFNFVFKQVVVRTDDKEGRCSGTMGFAAHCSAQENPYKIRFQTLSKVLQETTSSFFPQSVKDFKDMSFLMDSKGVISGKDIGEDSLTLFCNSAVHVINGVRERLDKLV